MPEWFSWVVLVSGLSVLVASLVYARQVLLFRSRLRESSDLLLLAGNAAYLPAEDREREFAEVSRLMWGRLGKTSPVYELYMAGRNAATPAQTDVDELGGLIAELADLQQSAGLYSPAAREKLARLRQQLDRPAR